MIGLALVIVLACIVFPRQLGTAVLFILVILAPLFNPAVAGDDAAGRLYASSVIMLLVIGASFGALLFSTDRRWPRALGYAALFLAAYVGLLYRYGGAVASQFLLPGEYPGTIAWLYRPLQPILVALAVTILLWDRRIVTIRLMRTAIIVGGIGAFLGFLNGAIPAFDPFSASRPADLAYRSALSTSDGGQFLRATGTFVYPNVFGLFCVFLVIAALGSIMYGFLNKKIAGAVVLAGLLGILTAGARADLGGLVVAMLYLGWVTDPKRRIKRILGAIFLVAVAIVGIAQTPTGASVISGRISSISGESGDDRLVATQQGYKIFSQVPIIGTGVRVSRIDNGFLLYLSMGGLIGFGLLCAAIYFVSRSDRMTGGWSAIPVPSRALIVAVAASSLLQDSLGQTLSSYMLGVCLGCFAVLGPPLALDVSRRDGTLADAPTLPRRLITNTAELR